MRLDRHPPQVPAVDPVGPAQFDRPALAARLAGKSGLLPVRHRRELTGAAARAPSGWCQSRSEVKARNVFRHARSLAEALGYRSGPNVPLLRVNRAVWLGGPQVVLT